MPEGDPIYLRVLEKLGFNVTRLRWKLFKLEQRRERLKNNKGLPEQLRWLKFKNKICRRCGAINDRDDKQCYRCERPLPSLLGYRIGRLFGFMIPQSAPHAIGAFVVISAALFILNILIQGFDAAIHPDGRLLLLFGGLVIDGTTGQFDWWRLMTFGVVHSGIFHIGFNCYAASVLSATTEVHLGAKRTVVLITISQLGAAFATWFWYYHLYHETVYTVGASGWVSGLLGYAIVYTWSLGSAGATYRRQLTQWAFYILAFGYFMGANNVGHIGGAMAGATVGFIQNRPGRVSPAETKAWEVAFWASVLLWVICLAVQGIDFTQNIGEFMALEKGQ